jgi:hypothetical protein
MAEALQPLYPAELRPIIEAADPRFSAGEVQRRRAMLAKLMARANVDHLLLYGSNRAGDAEVQTGECVLVTKTGIERLHTAPRGFARI